MVDDVANLQTRRIVRSKGDAGTAAGIAGATDGDVHPRRAFVHSVCSRGELNSLTGRWVGDLGDKSIPATGICAHWRTPGCFALARHINIPFSIYRHRVSLIIRAATEESVPDQFSAGI